MKLESHAPSAQNAQEPSSALPTHQDQPLHSNEFPQATQSQEIPKDVLGLDSLGNEIHPESVVIIDSSKGFNVTKLVKSWQVKGLSEQQAKVIAITEENIDQLDTILQVEPLPKEKWIDIDQLASKEEAYWRSIQNYIELGERNLEKIEKTPGGKWLYEENLPRGAIRLDDDFERFKGTVISKIELDHQKATVVFADPFDATAPITFTKNVPERLGASDIYGLYLEEGGKRQIAFFKGDLNIPDRKVEPKAVERMSSQEEVLARLRVEFPWLQKEDIENAKQGFYGELLSVPELPFKKSILTLSDYHRFRDAYGPARIEDVQNEKPNDHESEYLTARNYARMIQFQIRISNPSFRTPAIGQDYWQNLNDSIAKTTPEDRLQKSTEFLVGVEQEVIGLLKPRWQREEELFGGRITNPMERYIHKFATHQTMEEMRSVLGLYAFGTMTIMSDAFYQPEETPEQALVRVAEVSSHEIGHSGLQEKRQQQSKSSPRQRWNQVLSGDSWPSEEIWNQWKSVTFPRRLANSPVPKGYQDTNYNYKIASINDRLENVGEGGAVELDKMVEELSGVSSPYSRVAFQINGKLYEYSKDFVEKCALATAFARQETGIFNFMGQEVVGFKTLYDAYAKASGLPSFDQRLKGSDDLTYYKYSTQPAKMPDNPVEDLSWIVSLVTPRPETLEDKIHKKISQKVLKKVGS
ncbi:MAG: hypothetical protein AAB443_02420 [Patescibacteria group bacterium]